MARIRTLVVILAGGAGGRLELLTRERAKPAVPFAGTHRLIDFPLSNCLHAGLVRRVGGAAVQPDLAQRPPGQRPPVGPRPHDRRAAHPAAAPRPRRPHGLPAGHRRRAVAQRAADPRLRARGARRAERRRGLHARLRRAGRGAHGRRRRRDDRHRRGRPGRRRALRRRAGAGRPGARSTPTSRTSRRATWWPTRSSSSPRARCSTRWRRSRTTAGEDWLEDLGDELLPRLVDAGRRARAPLRRLLARRGHGRRLLGVPPGAGGRRPADRPRRPGLARAHPGVLAPRVGPRRWPAREVAREPARPGRARGRDRGAQRDRPRRRGRGRRGRARVRRAAGRRGARRARRWSGRSSTTASRSGAARASARPAGRSRSSACARQVEADGRIAAGARHPEVED